MNTQLADIKKPFNGAKSMNGISNNLYPNYNKTPTKKEILNGYFSANSFFRDAEKRKNKEAIWYFNQSRIMESKAYLALDWRNHFAKQASEYLELMVIARGGQDV